MKYLTESEKLIIGTKLLDFYMENGFGTRSKKDIDLFLFSQLKGIVAIKTLSIYELSNFLKITDSKVKNLILESSLRYSQHDENYRFVVINKIVNSIISLFTKRPDFDGKNLKFLLDDPIERREFENILKEQGYFSDTSFNKEIVTVRLVALVNVISKYQVDFEAKILEKIKVDTKNEAILLDKTLSLGQKIEEIISITTLPIQLISTILGFVKLS